MLRQKAAAVLRRSGYASSSHGGKAIMDVLDTYPRDELFQARLDELATDGGEDRPPQGTPPGAAVRSPDPYGRYLSCLVYLPRDRYTTAVRKRMQDILLRRLGGASIDYTARVTESVLARLHFVVRMPVGRGDGRASTYAPLERELTLATRSWNDEFADRSSAPGEPRGPGHPGRGPARGLQGGLHRRAGGARTWPR